MIKKYWNVFKECFFSTFSASLNKSNITMYQKKKIEKNIVINNTKTIVPISLIIIIAQIYFIISDISDGLYTRPFAHLNVIAEFALAISSVVVLFVVLMLLVNKCEKVGVYKVVAIAYYLIIATMLGLFVIAKLQRSENIENIDSSIVYLTFILSVCPLYSRFLTIGVYVIMAVIAITTSFIVGKTDWLASNMFLLSMGVLVSTYSCGRTIRNKINDEKLLELNSELSLKLDTDELTQVYNRRALKNYLEIKSNDWKESMAYVTFIMLDIDFFKKYNDTYGHIKGDECLKRVAQATNLAVQSFSGNVYRYGGEEFLIIAPNCTSDVALQIAKEVHKSIAKLKITHEANEDGKILTVSLGINVENSFKKNSSAWILEADNQLYRAKHEGRNCTSFENKIYKAR